MRKIKLLLVAVLAMVGLSAFAQAPADQATGYLYDAAGKKFINAEGAVGLTGMEFKALKQGTSKDYTTKDGTNRKFTSYRFKTLDGQHGLGVDNTNSTTLANNGIVTSTGTYGYGVFAVVPEEGQGFRIMSTYNRADFNVDYLYDYCLGYKADGTLFCFPEAEAPYWQFVDGETYKTTVAANAMPNANDVGYLYNLATKQFISADAVMDDNGVEFVIGEKVACGNHFGSEGKYIEEAGYSYIRFKLNGTSNYMRMINEGVTCKNSGYHKWATIGTEKGLVIRCIYVPSQVASAQQGYYLTPDAEGNLVLLEEPTDASYWQYMSKDDYDALHEDAAAAAELLAKKQALEYGDDATFAIVNPSFDAGNADGWTVTAKGTAPKYAIVDDGKGGKNAGMTCYNSAVKIEQTITDLKPGIYLLEAQAFGRAGTNAANLPKFYAGEVLETPAYLFANGVKTQAINIFDGAVEEKGAGNYTEIEVNGEKKYVLDNSSAGSYAFAQGKYEMEVIAEVGEDGKLTIGFEKTTDGDTGYSGCDNFRLTYMCPATKYPGGVYYLYNQEAGKFFSRGANWGTRATIATLGMPIRVQITETGINLLSLDWNGTGLGENLYTDRPSNEWMNLTVTYTANGVKLQNGGNYMFNDNGILSMGSTEDEWEFMSPYDYERFVKKAVADGKAKAFTDAGVADAAALAEYAEKDVTETALAGATLNNKDGWAWTPYPVNPRGGNYGAGAGILEVYQGAGTLTKTIEGLKPGLYKFTVNAFYRDGWNGNCVSCANAGFVMSTATINANGNFVRIADWASDRADDGNPNSMGQAADLFNAGKYVNEVYTYVGEDGVLELALDQPNYIDGGWFIFGNAKLTYYTDAISEEEAAELLAQIPTDPMNAEIKANLEAAKEAFEATPIIKNYKALSELIKEANTSVGQYAATKAALDTYAAKAAQLDKDGQAAYDVADIQTAYTDGTATADLSDDVLAAYIKAVKSQTSVGADMSGAIVNPGFQETPAGKGWTMVAGNKDLHGGGTEGNFCGESYHSTFTLSQTLTGMPAGTYSLTAQCFYRIDNGIDDIPVIFGNDDTALFPPMGNLPDHDGSGWQSMGDAAVEFNNGNYYLEIPVAFVVGEDGEITIGAKLETSTQLWCIWDNFTLTYQGTRTVDEIKKEAAIPAYLKALADAKEVLPETMDPKTLVKLNNAINTYAESKVLVDDATFASVQDATAALIAATDDARTSVRNAQALMGMYELMEQYNIVTPEAYDTYYAMFENYNKQYKAGTLTEAVESLNPYSLRGVRTDVNFDDYLLSAWTEDGVQCSNYDQGLIINSWSTEGYNDGTEFKVPFFEYWTSDPNTLAAKEFEATLTDLPAGIYEVTAWVRVRTTNGTDAADAEGVVFQVNEDDEVDVTNGEVVGQFNLTQVKEETIVQDGTLKVKFNVAEGNNISWLSFQNVKYTLLEEIATTISEIGSKAAAKSVFNVAGQQLSAPVKGLNIVDGKKVYVK
jgi:hypothetical protein